MKIISKREANSLELKLYFTGSPCKRGHISERYTRNSGCKSCVLEKNEIWKRLNPEKYASSKALWEKSNQEKIKDRRKNRPSRARKVEIVDPHRIISRGDARGLGIIYYYTGKPCKHGHYSDRFTSTAICLECNRINSERIRKANPDLRKTYQAAASESIKRRLKSDPLFKAMTSMRDLVRRLVRLSVTEKRGRTIDLLGYSPDDLVAHMELRFKDGMSWSNHGEWHIDHKIPVSVMIKRGVTDPSVINALSNLQPLWAEENRRKSARIE